LQREGDETEDESDLREGGRDRERREDNGISEPGFALVKPSFCFFFLFLLMGGGGCHEE